MGEATPEQYGTWSIFLVMLVLQADHPGQVMMAADVPLFHVLQWFRPNIRKMCGSKSTGGFVVITCELFIFLLSENAAFILNFKLNWKSYKDKMCHLLLIYSSVSLPIMNSSSHHVYFEVTLHTLTEGSRTPTFSTLHQDSAPIWTGRHLCAKDAEKV